MNRRLESAVLHGVLIAGGVVTLFPLFWMLSASFMSPGEAATFPPHLVPHAATLDAWSSKDWSSGIDVTKLSPLDELTVTTRNSTYTILIVCPASGEVKIRGGTFFPSFATARICGSSLGRGFLKRHVVHAGFCLEFTND